MRAIIPTLHLPPRITDDSVRLWRAAGAAGWNTLRLDRWQAPPDVSAEEAVVYGGFFIAISEEMGITLLEPPVEWLSTLPRDLTKREVRFMSLGEARRLRERAFYKPSDDKCFIAKVYEGGHELPPESELPATIPVLVSEIVHWQLEFRCFFLEGKLLTLSPYLRDGQRVDTAEGEFVSSDDEFCQAEAFARDFIARAGASLPPGIVVDIGIVADRGWAVIEANSAWGSGIYGCSAAQVLPVLRRVCVPANTLSDSDKRWARKA